jgi:hypothetical protein
MQIDHQGIENLLARLSETTSGEIKVRRTLFEKLRHELLRHAQTEQDVFYAALLEQGVDKDTVFDAIEDHAAISFMIGELETLSVSDNKWFQTFLDLSQTVRQHLQMEENLIFNLARERCFEAKLMGRIPEG